MFYDFCLKAGVYSDKSFIKGCTSLKLESIKHHEASNMHLLLVNKHVIEEKPERSHRLKLAYKDSVKTFHWQRKLSPC